MSAYDLPDELQVEVDGPIRIVRLNRPEQLNATNHVLHQGLADLFPQLDADPDARVAVITGNGRAFSAGGDFGYLDELTQDDDLRRQTLVDGRRIVTGMVACRLPVIAAVNGPAVGLGCSLVALSDIVFMAERAHLADPHVMVGLVAADGGPVTWPLLTSLQLAKEYALTGDRIPAERAPRPSAWSTTSAPTTRSSTRPWPAPAAIARLPQPGRRGHQADPEPAPRAGRAGHPRLRPHRRGPVVPLARAAGQPRPHARPRQLTGGASRGLRAHRRPGRRCSDAVRDVLAGRVPALAACAPWPRTGADDEATALWKTFVELDWPGLAVPGGRRRHRADRGRAGARARGAGPGRRPDAPSWPPPASTSRSCSPPRTTTSAARCSARCAPAPPAPSSSTAAVQAEPRRRRVAS